MTERDVRTRGSGRSWRAQAILLIVDASVLIAGCSNNSQSIVRPRGTEASRIAGLWWLLFGLAAAVYVIVAGFIVIAIVRGRKTESGLPSKVRDSTFIWWGGIIIPVIILMVVAGATVEATAQLRKPGSKPVRIEVVGQRWWWDVSYPALGIRTANEIHVPVGQPLEIGLDSDNVIHSFWVPELAGKLDTIPGQHNVLRTKVTAAGTYRGQCAQFCGLEHARMALLVIADPPDVFQRWVTRETRSPSPPEDETAAAGEFAFMRQPCAGCHTIRGTQAQGRVGPDLSDIGSRHWLGSITVPNDPHHLTEWILDAQSIKPGSLMPPISLSAADARAIVAYLEGLN